MFTRLSVTDDDAGGFIRCSPDSLGVGEKGLEVSVVVGDVHGGPAEDVGWANQAGEPDRVTKLLGRAEARQFFPAGLSDLDVVQEAGELEPVLGHVDALRGRAQHTHVLPVQAHGDLH